MATRPMTDDEVAAFVASHVEVYAADIARHAGWTPAEARAKAERDMAATFPRGHLRPEHTLLVLEEDGERVGELWLKDAERGLWLYWVSIVPERRGRGLGREAMRLVEEEARRRGAAEIELNVVGGNDAARSLYRSLGYVEAAVVMAKRL
jgi:ribosomal protein S18 acetylase RimI-like enzyme